MKFEIKKIDSWREPDGSWTWNDSFHVMEYETNGDNKRAFLRNLKKHGVSCKRGRCVVVDDGYCLTLEDRKTGEQYYAAIPVD